MQTIQLQLLTQCNSKCIFCNKHKWKFHEVMSIETIEAAFVKYNSANFIFSGGEPLMYPHLKELNELIEKYGIVYKVFTNLTLKAQDEIAVFLDNASQISTSFDAENEEQYQELRNCSTKDAFANLVNNVARYSRKTRACMVVTNKNFRSLPIIFSMILSLGALPRFYNVHTYDELALSTYDKQWLLNRLPIHRIKKQVMAVSNVLQFIQSLNSEHVEQHECQVKNNHRVIDELGREYTCCYAFDDNGTEMDTRFSVGHVSSWEVNALDVSEMYEYCSKCTRYQHANDMYRKQETVSPEMFL